MSIFCNLTSIDIKKCLLEVPWIKTDGTRFLWVEINSKGKEYFCAEFVSAHFNPLSCRIFINEDWLLRGDAIVIVRVITHEMMHAYHKIQVDFPHLVWKKHDANEVALWVKELAYYMSPKIVI